MRSPLAILSLLLVAAPANAETARIAAAPEPGLLTLEDGRTALIDGLLFPRPGDDGDEAAADRAAAQAHAAILAAVGKTVTLAPTLDGADRWNRLPADIFLDREQTWLQGDLLRQGHARIEACPRGDGDRLARLRAAEAEARQARRGLWRLKPYWPRRADRPMRAAGFAVVDGVPVADGGGAKRRYLNFAQDWRKDFTISADRPRHRLLERAGVGFESLIGQRILARGWLVWRNGPMLEIACPQQIETFR